MKDWKSFRENITDQSYDEKLTAVAEYFATVPLGARSVDYYTPADWLTPWEILHDRCYCKSSISILMYHTLKMVTDKKIDMTLIDDGEDMYLVPIIEDEYTMNYELGQLSQWKEIEKLVNVKVKFTEEEIKQIT